MAFSVFSSTESEKNDLTSLGLPEKEASARLETYGLNEIAAEEKKRWLLQLFRTLKSPFILLLLGLGSISFITDDPVAAVVISLMVTVSVIFTFVQEYRSSRAAEKLRAMVSTTATVIRDGVPREIAITSLVPGDRIHLSAGDMVPADVELVSAKDLFVSQAALTGEAMPVEKSSVPQVTPNARGSLDSRNLLFMGTNVVSGTAIAIVLRTGSQTYFGSIARKVAGTRVLTSFDKGVNRFTWLMIRFMTVMVPTVFLLNGFGKGDWAEAFLFAMAVAVGLTPEMLPMIVTVNLAKGALAMSRKKVIVKRLNSIQNFGAMDLLFTDKTGTLTQDKVILEKYVDVMGVESQFLLGYAYLNSFHQTGLKSLLDRAILNHVELKDSFAVDRGYRKIDEVPFDFRRRRMSVVVQAGDGPHTLICKGAVEEMFKVSSHALVDGNSVYIDHELRMRALEVARQLNEDGMRVIAVAHKTIQPGKSDYGVGDETGLTLIGYVAFLDPPKDSAAAAIQALAKHGVQVKILTGDNEVVSRKICKEVGIQVDRIAVGPEIDFWNDDELRERLGTINLFAKLNPEQKERIVHVAHKKGHVVGFMGDGINDAAALRASDVGISVDNAVDIAKESADIILLEKSLLVLEEGVIEGRRIFANIVKYIKMGASSNFGNVFSVVGASCLLPFLPIRPVQLLIQNLLYDLSQTMIPFDSVDPEELQKPRRWDIGAIKRFMFFFGPVSSIFDYAMFAVLWYVMGANGVANQALFQTGWFVEGLLSQTLVVHLIRTRRLPFVKSRAAWPLTVATLVVAIAGMILPFSPLAAKLGMVALPGSFFPWCLLILSLYAIATQGMKEWFYRRYGFN